MSKRLRLFIPNENHLSLLNEIGRWKVIALKDLYRELGAKTQYSPFCKSIRALEKNGLIQSFKGHRGKKYLALSDEGGNFISNATFALPNENELLHDLTVSTVLMSLLKFEHFKSGHIVNEDLELIPDALIYGVKNHQEYSLAIEVELHQKSKKRLVDKFSRYGQSNIFNHALYVVRKQSIFDAYRKVLLEMNDTAQERIILLLNESLREHDFDYLDSVLWFKKSEKQFLEVFR